MEKPKLPEKEKKNKGGRPTTYTEHLANIICERVATHTFGLKKLCAMYEDMPVESTINLWRKKDPEFSAQYAQAKINQADLLAEEILDIADDATNDWMATLGEDERGEGWKYNGEHVNRSRLRIDTRKWLASKLLPKTYGDHSQKEDDRENTMRELVDKFSDLAAQLAKKHEKDY